jgi:hypothetical protein
MIHPNPYPYFIRRSLYLEHHIFVKEALFLFADNEARDTFPIHRVLLDHQTKFGEWEFVAFAASGPVKCEFKEGRSGHSGCDVCQVWSGMGQVILHP